MSRKIMGKSECEDTMDIILKILSKIMIDNYKFMAEIKGDITNIRTNYVKR